MPSATSMQSASFPTISTAAAAVGLAASTLPRGLGGASLPTSLPSSGRAQRLAKEFACSGLTVAMANTCTNPIDLVKTRMQLASKAGGPRLGLAGTAVSVVKQEGALALWNGLSASLVRGVVYGGTRLGMYGPLKQAISADGTGKDLSTLAKVGAGCISGSAAAIVASPTELVKTQLQAKGSLHKTAGDVLRHVVHEEGITGLWRGAAPGAVRATILTAAQTATYDETKQAVMRQTGWGDCAATHLASAMIAGVVTTTAVNPADVLKTHMMMAGKAQQVAGAPRPSMLGCAAALAAREGPAIFMRGWTANYARLGPQTMITFIVAEKLRGVMGLGSI